MPTTAGPIRPARRRRARRPRVVAGLVVAGAAGFVGLRVAASASAPEPSGPDASRTPLTTLGPPAAADAAPDALADAVPDAAPRAAPDAAPPSTGLDPGLARAFRQAQADAAAHGYALTLTSGYRTPEEQRALLEAEVAERGSYQEAVRWVFPPDRSMHVQGLAVDVGDRAAAEWLADEGDRSGLCRTLAWEWWHFEWRPHWEATGTCPPPARTPSEAPTADRDPSA